MPGIRAMKEPVYQGLFNQETAKNSVHGRKIILHPEHKSAD
jgi:hypothetical protein